jgi:hypothetical protein
MRSTRLAVLALTCLVLCMACATRHQIPATERQLQGTVTAAEQAYKALYAEHKAGQLTKAAMTRVNELYNAWRSTNQMLIDAVRARAVEVEPAP